MAELQLHDVPEELVRRVETMDADVRKAVEAETVQFLEGAVARRPQHGQGRSQREIFDEMLRERVFPPPGTPTAAEIIREGRDER